MKITEDYSHIEQIEDFQFVDEEHKNYNKKADFKDYDSLNLFNLKTKTPESSSTGKSVTNILDVIFARSHDNDFIVTKKPHYRDLPKDLTDMEI